MGYLYRKSNGPRGAVFTSAVYQGFAGDKDDILDRMREITEKRESSQPTQRQDRRLDLQEPRGQVELAADRRSRLPRPQGSATRR